MANCKICGKPVTCALVVHDDCYRGIIEENARLRTALTQSKDVVDKYAAAARVVSLYLREFCDKSLPYDEMIADAARKAEAVFTRVRAERNDLLEYAKELKECEMCRHDTFCHHRNPTNSDCDVCGRKEKCPCLGCNEASRWEYRGVKEVRSNAEHKPS